MHPIKFKNKYRIPPARAQWWDYSTPSAYFITICTKNRLHHFGYVENGKMILSPTGIIADILWYEIPTHLPAFEIDAFQVMPNHIHGILIRKQQEGEEIDKSFVNTATRFQNQGKMTVSSAIGSYKSAVTKHANRIGLVNGWQASFHDHVIRNPDEYERIAYYIRQNPKNWKEDRFFSRL